MKHLSKFNENESKDIRLSKSEIESLSPNALKGYTFHEEFIIPFDYAYSKGTFHGKLAMAFPLHTSPREGSGVKYGSQIGFAIVIDGQPKHFVIFYEPHGCRFVKDKDLFIAYGHENVELLWSNGDRESIHTR